MKKIYTTPTIAIERYELSQAIAACSTKIGALDSECVKRDPDSTEQMKDYAWDENFSWFYDGTCIDGILIHDGNDSICYHTNNNTAFTSQ